MQESCERFYVEKSVSLKKAGRTRRLAPDTPQRCKGGFAGATLGETNVRVFGDIGVLMGMINTDSSAQPNQVRVTLVFQRRGQGWQMIAAHMA